MLSMDERLNDAVGKEASQKEEKIEKHEKNVEDDGDLTLQEHERTL